jgi:hypothetical protein
MIMTRNLPEVIASIAIPIDHCRPFLGLQLFRNKERVATRYATKDCMCSKKLSATSLLPSILTIFPSFRRKLRRNIDLKKVHKSFTFLLAQLTCSGACISLPLFAFDDYELRPSLKQASATSNS